MLSLTVGYRTYDEYTSELASGHLSWTPVHESDDFWKENASKLNDKNNEQLKYAEYHFFAFKFSFVLLIGT